MPSCSSSFSHNSQVLAHYIIKPLNFPVLVMFKLDCLTLASRAVATKLLQSANPLLTDGGEKWVELDSFQKLCLATWYVKHRLSFKIWSIFVSVDLLELFLFWGELFSVGDLCLFVWANDKSVLSGFYALLLAVSEPPDRKFSKVLQLIIGPFYWSRDKLE